MNLPKIHYYNIDILTNDIDKSNLKPYHTQQNTFTPTYQLNLPRGKSLFLLPYYLAGGREDGAWRLTWVQNKIY